MIVVVPASDASPGNRRVLTTNDLERPGRTMTAIVSLGGDRRNRGGDAYSDRAPS
jgi:hypothetical protein